MLQNFKRKLQSKSGEFALELGFKIIAFAAFIAILISVAGALIRINQANMMANELTRFVELQGEVNSAVHTRLGELIDNTNLDVDMDIQGNYIGSGKRIQFGDSFEITLRYQVSIGLGGFIQLPLELDTTATGRSEKYWK